MLDTLRELESTALQELSSAQDEESLERWRVQYLGKKGAVTQALRGLGALAPADRPAAGQAANALRDELQLQFDARQKALEQMAALKALEAERIDVTLPGRTVQVGQVHPLTQTVREILDVFVMMGFQVAEGPEIEWDYYNFEALNIPPDHPARDMWDTFYVDADHNVGKMLLRTHTSPNQVRIMEKTRPPVRVVVPGKCYRYEAVDASHEAMFYQIEGLAVDEGITMADLKGVLTAFAHHVFGRDRTVRFRCDYFPFVEPGAEMAVECWVCKGSGCRLCKHTGWIEIMGAGMVHPRVLERVGYDPSVYSGFAFGMGPERVAMLKHGIDDIRLFYGNDLRFLRQFR